MIRFMGNISLRLWIITLTAVPACFYFMPFILQFFPGVPLVISSGILFFFIGSLIGVSLDFIGRKLLGGVIKEGEIWERAGILSRAEKSYARAVRIYGSFLLSPFFAGKIGTHLTEVLARFSLTTAVKNPQLTLASAVYLISNPGDETLAALWLEQIKKNGLAGNVEQEVLTALADLHYSHKKLVFLLADVMLDLGRMDYSAKRLYRTIIDEPKLALEIKTAYREKIFGLIGEPEIERPETSVENFGMGRVILPSSSSTDREKRFLNSALYLLSSFYTSVVLGMKCVVRCGASFLSFCVLCSGRAIAWLRERERVRFYLVAGTMGILSLWLLFFMVNTISHILNSRAVEKEPGMIEIHHPRPFTIQVAAYLKQVHADRYVAILKKKGFAPFIIKVKGGGKTWYVVRVSEFSDETSAAAFGKKLKTEKVIDDFFVCNK